MSLIAIYVQINTDVVQERSRSTYVSNELIDARHTLHVLDYLCCTRLNPLALAMAAQGNSYGA